MLLICRPSYFFVAIALIIAGCTEELANNEGASSSVNTSPRIIDIIDLIDRLCVQHNNIEEIVSAAASMRNAESYSDSIIQKLNETAEIEGDYQYRAAYDLRIASEEYTVFVSDFTDKDSKYVIRCTVEEDGLRTKEFMNAISQKYLSTKPSWKSFFCKLADRNVEGAAKQCGITPHTFNSDWPITLAVDENMRLFYFRFYDDSELDLTQIVWDFKGEHAADWFAD